MAEGPGDILSQFAEFLAAKQASEQADDHDVFLATTDKDGNRHELSTKASTAAGWMRDHFGIGPAPAKADGKDGKDGDGKQDPAGGGKKPGSVADLFRPKASGQ